MKIKPLSVDSPVARFLAWLAGVVFRHRRLFLYPQLALFVLCILITVKYPGIEFDTSRNNLVGANKKYHQNFLRFKKEFPTQDDLVVVVESENAEKNRQFVERLGAKLEAETNVFHDVFYKGRPQNAGPQGPAVRARRAIWPNLSKTLKDFRPFIAQFTRTTNLISLFKMVCAQFRTAKQEANAENESLVNALPALERIITQATDSLRRQGTPPSPGITALFDPGERCGAADLHHLCQRAHLPGDGPGADRRPEQRGGRAIAAIGGGNQDRGAGAQRWPDGRAGVGAGRNGAVAEGHHRGRVSCRSSFPRSSSFMAIRRRAGR